MKQYLLRTYLPVDKVIAEIGTSERVSSPINFIKQTLQALKTW